MEYGTVPSGIKNIVDGKDEDFYLNSSGLNNYPFTVNSSGKNYLLQTQEEVNLGYLSKTDIEALNVGIKKYGSKSFGEVEKLNHEEKSWKETTRNCKIDFELSD